MKKFFQNKMFQKISLSTLAIALVLGGFLVFNNQVNAAVTTITVTSPNGGETWGASTLNNITWTTDGGAGDHVSIYRCIGGDCSLNKTLIASNIVANSGTYSWNTSGLTIQTDKILVRDLVSETEDASNASFTLQDTAKPTVVSVSMPGSPFLSGQTGTLTIVFSEPVNNFTNADLTVLEGGALSPVSSADGGITWTATFTPTNPLTDSSNIITVSTVGLTDLAGNAGVVTASTSSYSVDTIKPTLSIVLADTALLAGETSGATFTFSEAVTGFDNTDMVYTDGGLLSTIVGGPTIYTGTFTPTAGIISGTNIFSTGSNWTDANGNAPVAGYSSGNYTINTVRPTVAVTMGSNAFKVGESTLVTFTFSETPTGFDSGDVTVGTGSIGAINNTNLLAQTATYTPTDNAEEGTNIIRVGTGWTNAATNAPAAVSDSPNYVVDTKEPTLVSAIFTDDTLKAGETSLVTFTFSEPVYGLANDDLTIANGTMTNVYTDNATTWTSTFTPTVDIEDASNVISVDMTGLADDAVNIGLGSADSSNYAIDTYAPVISAGADAGEKTALFTHTDPTAAGAGIVSYAWSKVSGLGTITFSSDATLNPGNITASAYDNYVARLTVTDNAGNVSTDDFTFSWLPAAGGLIINDWSPEGSEIGVAVANGTATITFNSNITLLDATKVTLVDNDSDVSKKGTVAVSGGNGTSAILNIPYTGLQNAHTYRINIAQNAVRDGSNNTNYAAVSYFTTIAAEPTNPIVTKTELTKSIATKNGLFADGWHWVLDVTIPSDETEVKMSFGNLTGAGTILAANHIRFYSAEASNYNLSSNPIMITGTDTWSTNALSINDDLDPNTVGKQIQIIVEAAVPSGTTDGAYSASYDIQTTQED